MTNLAVVPATGGTAYLKASGAGTSGDPYITENTISGTVAVSGPLTDAELRASAVPVSGTIAATGPLTDAELRAAAVPVDVASVAAPSAIFSGQTIVTTAGTAVALTTTQAISSGVTVKGLSTNTGIVYVGNSAVDSSNGFELAAGEAIFIDTDDLATVFVDAAVSGEGVSFISS